MKSNFVLFSACYSSLFPSQSLAAQAGLRILEQGGNAADAAVAVAAALNVTQPTSTGTNKFLFVNEYKKRTC